MASLKEDIPESSSSDSEIVDFEFLSDSESFESDVSTDDSGKGESVITPEDDKYDDDRYKSWF